MLVLPLASWSTQLVNIKSVAADNTEKWSIPTYVCLHSKTAQKQTYRKISGKVKAINPFTQCLKRWRSHVTAELRFRRLRQALNSVYCHFLVFSLDILAQLLVCLVFIKYERWYAIHLGVWLAPWPFNLMDDYSQSCSVHVQFSIHQFNWLVPLL